MREGALKFGVRVNWEEILEMASLHSRMARKEMDLRWGHPRRSRNGGGGGEEESGFGITHLKKFFG